MKPLRFDNEVADLVMLLLRNKAIISRRSTEFVEDRTTTILEVATVERLRGDGRNIEEVHAELRAELITALLRIGVGNVDHLLEQIATSDARSADERRQLLEKRGIALAERGLKQ